MMSPDKKRAMGDLRCAGKKLVALFEEQQFDEQAVKLEKALEEAHWTYKKCVLLLTIEEDE